MSAGRSGREVPLPEGGAPEVRAFWASLSRGERREIQGLYEAETRRAPFEGALRAYGRFVEASRAKGRDREEEAPFVDYYEYLVNHEIYLTETERYHVCTRHEAAAEVVRAGLVPADFTCPLGRAECPMRRISSVAPGRALEIRIAAHGDRA